jgi:hypothetical protein
MCNEVGQDMRHPGAGCAITRERQFCVKRDFFRTRLRVPVKIPVRPRPKRARRLIFLSATDAEERVRPVIELFQFVRASDRARMSCVVRFHDNAFGWEVRFFDCNVFIFGRGAFPTRALAIQWALAERDTLQRERRR